MSKPYRECPDCGDHLDAGEICDCKESRAAAPELTEAGQQAAGNPHRPVLDTGA